ncbi:MULTISPECIES: hypothetical protein [Rhodococcus]|jgi:hypothetical protein|uniref:Uncharacterized protein n=2 Tax=Rhodococcus erythropolis group TaxID=2840174 RepID=A0AAW6LQC9_RHOSG|nr:MULTISPECIES: hypothetical protein [Rhodococcus]MDE8647485.1 hypothetical protein [Rhodococcus qingshengii]
MSDSSGGIRGMWFGSGPMLVISQLGDVTSEQFETSVMETVNNLMDEADGVGVDDPNRLDFGPASSAAPPVAPPVAPQVAPASPMNWR